MTELGVWDTYSVKAQTVKTAIEVSSRLSFIAEILVVALSFTLNDLISVLSIFLALA